MTPPCVVPTFRPFAAENLEFGGFYASSCESRVKIEDTREGLVATISQGDDGGKITGRPSIFLVGGKEEAKQRAKAVARALGLKTYRVLDRTSSRSIPPDGSKPSSAS